VSLANPNYQLSNYTFSKKHLLDAPVYTRILPFSLAFPVGGEGLNNRTAVFATFVLTLNFDESYRPMFLSKYLTVSPSFPRCTNMQMGAGFDLSRPISSLEEMTGEKLKSPVIAVALNSRPFAPKL
jgi:hypothetical protein